MTNETIVTKLKEITSKLLVMSKRLKKLEEKKDTVEGWQPNEKFIDWYEGTFAEEITEEGLEELEELVEEAEAIQEQPEDNELTEVLEELDEAINDA